MTDDERELFEMMLAELQGIRLAVEALHNKRGPDHGALLAAISELVGDATFTTRELLHHYAEPLSDLAGGMTPKQLGRLFRNIEGADLDGWTVERIGQDADGIVWRVRGTWSPKHRKAVAG